MGFPGLGREYEDGEVVCRQGEPGNCMYLVQEGEVEIVHEEAGVETLLGRLRAGDIVGEMAIFDRQPRSATVRVAGRARLLTLDKRAFLRQISEDPSLAFRILKQLSLRIRALSAELARIERERQQRLTTETRTGAGE
ncbi:MAG: cyclic nucleotide-binding domain-containing protein [Gaiellaceae bacterium]